MTTPDIISNKSVIINMHCNTLVLFLQARKVHLLFWICETHSLAYNFEKRKNIDGNWIFSALQYFLIDTQVKLGPSDSVGQIWNSLPHGYRIRSVTLHQNPMISDFFLSSPLIGFNAFRSDPYSRNRLYPVLEYAQIRRDLGPSGTKKRSEFVLWDSTKSHPGQSIR